MPTMIVRCFCVALCRFLWALIFATFAFLSCAQQKKVPKKNNSRTIFPFKISQVDSLLMLLIKKSLSFRNIKKKKVYRKGYISSQTEYSTIPYRSSDVTVILFTGLLCLHLCMLYYVSIACSLIKKLENVVISVKRDFLNIAKISTQQEKRAFYNRKKLVPTKYEIETPILKNEVLQKFSATRYTPTTTATQR